MSQTDLVSFNDLLALVLSKSDEETDGTSDWAMDAQSALIEQHRLLIGLYPWLSLEKYPPGVVLVPAVITSATITITAGQTSGTFGGSAANYAASKLRYKFRPTGKDYAIRITAHTAESTSFTADAAPETLSAQAGNLYLDEVALPSDFHLFVNACWTHGGQPIPVKSEEDLRRDWDLTSGSSWPPKMACRVGQSRVRFSHVPDAQKRVEIPYTYDPGDPSGASTMTIESYLRPILAQMALPTVLRLKKALGEAREADAIAQRMLSRAIERENNLRRALFGRISQEQSDDVPLYA